jgi:hypothetical protein
MKNKTFSLCLGLAVCTSAFPALAQTQDKPAGNAAEAAGPAEKAIDRLPEHLLYIYVQPGGQPAAPFAERQLSASKRRWEQGRTLRVCLFGGNPVVARLIREVAGEWNNYVNIKFDFGPADGWYNCLAPTQGFYQIRIGFSEKGYWSTVGNDAEGRLLPLQPSMNFENFNILYSDLRQPANAGAAIARPYDLAVIRHEFNHALGLLHEHQNPALNCYGEIRWKGPGNVYEYFSKPPNNWNPSEVERNLGYVGTTDPDYEAGEPDVLSIMMYSLPAEVFINGTRSKCYVHVNYTISPKDKAIVATIYPPGAANIAQAPGDLDIRTANLSQLPHFVDAPNRRDVLSRALADLQSPDKYIRRDARARLADVFRKGTTSGEIASLVDEMKQASYRFQLGVAVALANARGATQLDSATRKELQRLSNNTRDLTLKRALQAASK